MNTKNPFRKSVYGKNTSRKGIVGITLAAIMIVSIFAMVVPTAIGKANPPAPSVVPNATIRIYGDMDKNAPERYTEWDQPFDPSVIPPDSITFNPAILKWGNISANSTDAYQKIYLRAWYEPNCTYGLPGGTPRKTHYYPDRTW
jgi:hypothetical protein